MSSNSHEEAAIDFLDTEDGPFGTLLSVSKHHEPTKEFKFFHTKTLLDDINLQTSNQRTFSLVHFEEENV